MIHSSQDPDAGKGGRPNKNGAVADELVGWHHRPGGHELSRLWEMVKDRMPGMLQSISSRRVRHDLATE